MHLLGRACIVVFALMCVDCSVLGNIAAAFAGSDSSCDRRYGKSQDPQPFCQELVDSVAGPDFRDDCDTHLQGKSNEDRCPRDHAIGGCEIDKTNQDGSTVTDWYYDVSALVESGEPFRPESL